MPVSCTRTHDGLIANQEANEGSLKETKAPGCSQILECDLLRCRDCEADAVYGKKRSFSEAGELNTD